jgi:excisionase family DNA binding protein
MKLDFMNTTTIPEHQTLDVNSNATELGVRKETVRRLVRRKVLRKLPGLRRILIPKAELQRFLEAGDRAIPLKTLSKSGPEKVTACVSILPLRD